MMIPRQFDIWNSKNHKPKILKPKLLFSLKNSRNSARLHLKIWLIHVECDKRYHRSNEKDSASEWNNRQRQHGHEHYHAFEPVVHDTYSLYTHYSVHDGECPFFSINCWKRQFAKSHYKHYKYFHFCTKL